MLLFFIFFAYVCGSIPWGKLIAHTFYGVDIQKRGSGNIGFANVRRTLGWRAGIATLTLDIAKGALPTYLASLQPFSRTAVFFIGFAAIIGHLFPLWLKFRGGKGIATGLGVVIVLQPLASLIGSVVYVVSAWRIRKSSVASLLGLVSVCVCAIVIQPSEWWMYGVLIATALWTLRKNLAGTVPNYDT